MHRADSYSPHVTCLYLQQVRPVDGRTSAKSPLVKTASYGEDAHRGRIIAAAGYSGQNVDPERMSLWFGGVHVFTNGTPTDYTEADATASMKPHDITIRLDLGRGDASATV